MMSRQQRKGRISALEMQLPQPPNQPIWPSAWVFRSGTFGPPQDADVFTNDVPRERGKVFYIVSPRKLAEFPPIYLFYLSAATPLFLHLPLDWWSIFLFLWVAPNLAKGNRGWLGQFPSGNLAPLLTSWNRAAVAATWHHDPNEKTFCSPPSRSSCLQELIPAALKEVLLA